MEDRAPYLPFLASLALEPVDAAGGSLRRRYAVRYCEFTLAPVGLQCRGAFEDLFACIGRRDCDPSRAAKRPMPWSASAASAKTASE